MSLPWQYSRSFFDKPESRPHFGGWNLGSWRRAVGVLGAFLPDEGERTRLITVAQGQEAQALTVAFMRFAELHGRIVLEPRSRCAIQTAVRRNQDRRETRIVTFWSRRAAEKFDRFWPRYRAAYGAG